MSPTADPRRQLRRRAVAQHVVAGVAVAALAMWAVLPPRLPPAAVPTPKPHGAPTASAVSAKDLAATWNLRLWRPVRDAPAAAPPAAAPLACKVVFLLEQGGERTAAVDTGNKAPLIFVKLGDALEGGKVTRIDDQGLELEIAGAKRRVERVQ